MVEPAGRKDDSLPRQRGPVECRLQQILHVGLGAIKGPVRRGEATKFSSFMSRHGKNGKQDEQRHR